MQQYFLFSVCLVECDNTLIKTDKLIPSIALNEDFFFFFFFFKFQGSEGKEVFGDI